MQMICSSSMCIIRMTKIATTNYIYFMVILFGLLAYTALFLFYFEGPGLPRNQTGDKAQLQHLTSI